MADSGSEFANGLAIALDPCREAACRLGGRGTQFNVPLPQGGEQRIRIERLLEDSPHYQRVIFESLGDQH
jgi:hypothetical protein